MSKEEIKVGDCFKHDKYGVICVTLIDTYLSPHCEIRTIGRNRSNGSVETELSLASEEWLTSQCTRITPDEFRAARDAAIAQITKDVEEALKGK